MRVLLTGACGALGRAIRRLGGEEHTFVLFDMNPEVEAEGGRAGTLTDAEAVRSAAEGCDAIIHTAAMHGAFYGKAETSQFIETNVLGSEHIFQAAMEHGIRRIVASSTMEVLIGRHWGAYGTAIVDESFAPRPDWAYPLSKVQAEELGRYYAREHGRQVTQLRYMSFDSSPIAKWGHNLLARRVDVEDAARANLAALHAAAPEATCHIGPDTPLSQYDINRAQKEPEAVLEHYWPGCVEVMRHHGCPISGKLFWPVTRIDRARQVLGWQPKTNFADFLSGLGWAAHTDAST